MSVMHIAVLGGSGFIGSRLVSQLLAAGHQVRIFDIAPSSAHPTLVTHCDVRNAAAVTQALYGCDCAINLAAEHRDDVRPASRYVEVNVGGAENVVRAAEANGVTQIVFLSSVAVYGLDQPLATESAAIQPCNDYGRSKAQAETVYAEWAAASAQRSLVLLRPAVVFGEGNQGNVFNLIDQIRRRRFLMVGRGENRKSVAYVGNLVDFICARIDAAPGVHLFNYADKPDLSTAELVQQIRASLPGSVGTAIRIPYSVALALAYLFDALARLSGRPMAISSARVRKFCADTQVATSALEESGFQPKFTIQEGLARMVAAIEADELQRKRGSP
jgi:nucleoside-diphosphate-sugar epimerase